MRRKEEASQMETREEMDWNWRGEPKFERLKQLKEENAQLWNAIHPVTQTKKSNGMQNVSLTTEAYTMENYARRDGSFLQRTHSYDPTEVQKMMDEIKTLNVVIQQLQEDKTDLIEKQNRTQLEIRAKNQLTKTQEAKLHDNSRKDEQKSFEIELLKKKILDLKNQNASINLIIKENFHRLKW